MNQKNMGTPAEMPVARTRSLGARWAALPLWPRGAFAATFASLAVFLFICLIPRLACFLMGIPMELDARQIVAGLASVAAAFIFVGFYLYYVTEFT